MQASRELVERARAGDRGALEALAVAVYGDVWRLLRSELAREADAEDATQEAFREMVASIHTLREPAAFAGWLYRIALDKARHVRRATAELPRRASTQTEGGGPVATLEKQEMRTQVNRAVEGLDEDLRRTVRLRYEHALSYGEIAAAMEVPEGTVARRLNTAHERLKRVLAGVGVVLALASLETELSAAPAEVVPERVALKVKRIARESPLAGPGPVPKGPRPRTVAAGLFAALALSSLVAWKLFDRGRGKPESGSGVVAAGSDPRVATPGDVPSASQPSGKEAAKREAGRAPAVAPGTLRGKVFDRDSQQPVPDAIVRLAPVRENPDPAGILETRCDSGGNYMLSAAAGGWTVTTMAPGYVPYAAERWVANRRAVKQGEEPDSRPFTENSVELAAGLECVRDLELVSGLSVRGKVVNSAGFAVAGARVRFSQVVSVPRGSVGLFQQNFNGPDPNLTDLEGRFAFDAVFKEGELQFDIDAAGYRQSSRSVAVVPEMPEVVIELEGKPVIRAWGTVHGPDGSPLVGAVVFVSDGSMLTPFDSGTDNLGRFDHPGVPCDGPIAVWKEGCGMAVFPPGSIPAGGLNVRLKAADAEVSGIVVGDDGRPLAGASVTINAIGMKSAGAAAWLGFRGAPGGISTVAGESCSYLPASLKVPSMITGEDGRFAFKGFALGDGYGVQLDVMREGHRRQELQVLEIGEVRVEMKPF